VLEVSPNETKVLRFLVDNCDPDYGCFPFDCIKVGLDRATIRRACRSLKRKGFTEYERGLWSDEGKPAGAGYRATKAGCSALDGAAS
jgi:hypothetical protein